MLHHCTFQGVWRGQGMSYTTMPRGKRMTARRVPVSTGGPSVSPCCVRPGVPAPAKSRASVVRSVTVGVPTWNKCYHTSSPYSLSPYSQWARLAALVLSTKPPPTLRLVWMVWFLWSSGCYLAFSSTHCRPLVWYGIFI